MNEDDPLYHADAVDLRAEIARLRAEVEAKDAEIVRLQLTADEALAAMASDGADACIHNVYLRSESITLRDLLARLGYDNEWVEANRGRGGAFVYPKATEPPKEETK